MDEPKTQPAPAPNGAKQKPLTKAMKRKLAKPVKTANGRIIRDLMLANDVKGSYKDYVIISGERLIDWTGSFDIFKDGRPLRAEAVALIHKSKLAKVIGDDAAKVFWRPGFGRIHSKPQKTVGDEKHLEAAE